MVCRIFSVRKYAGNFTLFDICIPAIDIRIIMVKAYMPVFPDKTVGPHQIEYVHKCFIQPAAFKNSVMNRIMDNIEVDKNQQ